MGSVVSNLITIGWNFNIPPTHLRDQPLQLLTLGRIAIEGIWSGRLAEHFVAWAPLENDNVNVAGTTQKSK